MGATILVVPNQNGEEIQKKTVPLKDTIWRVSLVCLFVSLKKSALCWMVFWAGKPKVGCCASGSGNQSCYVKVAFGPRLRLHPNVRWNAQKSAIYRSRWRSSVWSRESPRTPPRTPPTHHPMHLNLGTALVIFNTKRLFIFIIKLIGPIDNAWLNLDHRWYNSSPVLIFN